MTTSDEYNSLRQELIQHQERRLTILGLAVTATAALIAAGLNENFRSAFVPLSSLMVLFSARVLITEAQYGIKRISSYIRVVLEDEGENPALKWETGSYKSRERTRDERKHYSGDISALASFDNVLFGISLVAITMAIYISWPTSLKCLENTSLEFWLTVGFTPFWLLLWFYYRHRRVNELINGDFELREAEFWRLFKQQPLKTDEDLPIK